MGTPVANTMPAQAELVDLSSVQQHPDNPNNGDVEQVAESLRLNGQWKPIVVDKTTRYILAGNTTYAAALSLGWTHIWAWLIEPHDKSLNVLLGDNKYARLARVDEAQLLAVLQDLPTLDGTGYTAQEVDDLVAVLEEVSTRPLNLPGQTYPGAVDTGRHDGNQPEVAAAGGQTGDNTRFDPTYGDYAERYAQKASRLVVLEYPLDEYNRLVEQLAKLRQHLGVESNAEVVSHLVDKAAVEL